MKNKAKVQAVAYLRTSSAANVGGDSGKRQLMAIRAYAKAAGVGSSTPTLTTRSAATTLL